MGVFQLCKFIGMEDLVANALIEIIEKKKENKVSFEQLRKYGAVIVRWFKDNADNEEVVILVSRFYTNELIRNYSDFFKIIDSSKGDSYIELKETKTAEDLRNHFRSYLSIDTLLAFTDKNSLLALDVGA